MPEVLTADQAVASGIGVGMVEEDLETAIDEEEAWLARRIGPLLGERTERFALAGLRPRTSTIRLRRPTDAVEATLDGVDLDPALLEVRGDGWEVASLPDATYYTGPLEVTYTPNDEVEVRRALRGLLALTLGDQAGGGLQAEIMGSYSYTRAAGSATRIRRSIVRSLQGPSQAGSTRLVSSVRHGVAGQLGR